VAIVCILLRQSGAPLFLVGSKRAAYSHRLSQPQGLSKGSDGAPNPPLGLVDAAVGVWVVDAEVHPP
jgi:hypothetical protein